MWEREVYEVAGGQRKARVIGSCGTKGKRKEEKERRKKGGKKGRDGPVLTRPRPFPIENIGPDRMQISKFLK